MLVGKNNGLRSIITLLLVTTLSMVFLLKPASVLLSTETIEMLEQLEVDKREDAMTTPSPSPGRPASSQGVESTKASSPSPTLVVDLNPSQDTKKTKTMEDILAEINSDTTETDAEIKQFSKTLKQNVTAFLFNKTPASEESRGQRASRVPQNSSSQSLYEKSNEHLLDIARRHKSLHCLSPACLDEIANPIARAFPDQLDRDKWCRQQTNTTVNNNTSPKHQGLILVKVPKSASSTMAGVVLRLAHRHNCNRTYIHWAHEKAHINYAHRDPTQSVMITSVRDPASRIVSNVFWSEISLRGIQAKYMTEPTVTHQIVKRHSVLADSLIRGQGGFTIEYTAMEEIPTRSAWSRSTWDVIHTNTTVGRVERIIQGYDFVAVVERMDESLVALSLLLGVHVSDVLVTSSKVSAAVGGNASITSNNSNGSTTQLNSQSHNKTPAYVYSQRKRRCLPMIPSYTPALAQEYFDSDVFRAQLYGDYLLYAAANQSLDLTIERLAERFQVAMKEYRVWKAREKVECASRVEFPCSMSGKVQLDMAAQNCYTRDIGCGHACLDEMLVG